MFSLILAIGSQNAFVLRQGLKQEHVFWVCLVCSLSDLLFIGAGVAGFSSLLRNSTDLIELIRYAGVVFLILYGLMHLYNAIRGGHSLEAAQDKPSKRLLPVILITLALTWLNPHVYLDTLALTWLNPHVYLDTLLLIGSVSTQYPNQAWEFFIGASLASVLFFFSLGYGARYLQPLFKQPRA